MKYEPLYKTYYNDKEKYKALYESRINDIEVVKLGIEISGNEAFYLPCSEMFSLINDILRMDKKVALMKKKLPEEAVSQFRLESLIDEIVITNKIEGIHSTRREIRDVIVSLDERKKKEKRFEGLVNQYRLLGERNIELIACKDIGTLYAALVLNEVIENDPRNAPDGEMFRKDKAVVRNSSQKVIHEGVYPETKIIEYMQKSLDILNDDSTDILIRAAVFHYLFGYIHPYYDGNGRMSRFISSYYLSADLDSLMGNRLSYTIQDNIGEYYKMFKVCNDRVNMGDITPFIIMFLNIVFIAEENLLYALTKRFKLYQSNSLLILSLAAKENWDNTTKKLCNNLLISSLFSKNGLSKNELLGYVGIKSKTTLNTKLEILKQYDLVEEMKEGNSIYYKLNTEKLIAT